MRCKKLGYSEDLMLELRGAAYARQIGGPTFEAGPMRYQQGQSQDPTASLETMTTMILAGMMTIGMMSSTSAQRISQSRCTKGLFVGFRECALTKCGSHAAAARQYPDLNASFSARAASNLRHPENWMDGILPKGRDAEAMRSGSRAS